jgi:hypothetical protein
LRTKRIRLLLLLFFVWVLLALLRPFHCISNTQPEIFFDASYDHHDRPSKVLTTIQAAIAYIPLRMFVEALTCAFAIRSAAETIPSWMFTEASTIPSRMFTEASPKASPIPLRMFAEASTYPFAIRSVAESTPSPTQHPAFVMPFSPKLDIAPLWWARFLDGGVLEGGISDRPRTGVSSSPTVAHSVVMQQSAKAIRNATFIVWRRDNAVAVPVDVDYFDIELLAKRVVLLCAWKYAFPVVFRLIPTPSNYQERLASHPDRHFPKLKQQSPKTKIDTVRYTSLSDTGSICVYSTALHYATLIRLQQ